MKTKLFDKIYGWNLLWSITSVTASVMIMISKKQKLYLYFFKFWVKLIYLFFVNIFENISRFTRKIKFLSIYNHGSQEGPNLKSRAPEELMIGSTQKIEN